MDQIPPLTWQIESDEYAQRASPDVLTFAQRLPRNMPFLSLSFLNDPQMREISNRFQEAVRQVVVENADVQTALDDAQSKPSRSSTRPVQIMYNRSGLLLENGQNSIIDFVVVHPYPCFEWGSYDYYPQHTPVFTDAIEQAAPLPNEWSGSRSLRNWRS